VTPVGNGSFLKVKERAIGGGMQKRRMKMGSMATLVWEKEIISISSMKNEGNPHWYL
jgi:hypothetical protein